jgi:hypothetical protein
MHSLHTTEPLDFLNTCLSVGLMHTLHNSSFRILNSFKFTDALLASAQCTLVELFPRVFNNSVSYELQLLRPHRSLSLSSLKGYMFPLGNFCSMHTCRVFQSIQQLYGYLLLDTLLFGLET